MEDLDESESGESRLTRVAFVQNFIVPYEVPLFESLARQPRFELVVLFLAKRYKSRSWSPRAGSQYVHEVLPGITVELGRIVSSFNPGIVSRLRKTKPDVLVLSGGYQHLTIQVAFLLAKVMSIPVVYRSDEFGSDGGKRSILARLASSIEKVMIRRSDAIVCPGKRAVDYNLRRGAKRDSIFVSPYTTEDDLSFAESSKRFRLRVEYCKRELGIRHRQVILYVGSFTIGKGIPSLLAAFKTLKRDYPDAALVMLGDGPLAHYLKEEGLGELAGSLFLPGFIQGERRIEYYSIADVFVLPTLRDLWGIVVNEAMLCGVPVIVTAAAGASEMIRHQSSGIILQKLDPNALADAMRKLLLEEQSARLIGLRGREVALRDYNLEKRTQAFVAAINRVETLVSNGQS